MLWSVARFLCRVCCCQLLDTVLTLLSNDMVLVCTAAGTNVISAVCTSVTVAVERQTAADIPAAVSAELFLCGAGLGLRAERVLACQ